MRARFRNSQPALLSDQKIALKSGKVGADDSDWISLHLTANREERLRLVKASSLSMLFAIGSIAWFAVMLVLGETDYRTRPVVTAEPTIDAAPR
jgi:hypothetical protein